MAIRGRPDRRWTGLAALVALVLAGSFVHAQFGPGRFRGGFLVGEQGDPAELPPATRPDGNLAACHLLYTSVRREANGAGWRTDYPWGERHLLLRLSELTKTRISWVSKNVAH